MGGVVSAARNRVACGQSALVALALVVMGAPAARAIDFLEGRVQVHGYVEEQVRGINRNWNEQLDLTQMATILRVDIDSNIIENPIGFLESMRAYTRFEVRYDCVYTRACGLFPSANVYGNRARQLPDRLANAAVGTFDGVIPTSPPVQLLTGNRPGALSQVFGYQALFGFQNPDGKPQDAPALYTFKNFLDYRFAQRKIPGSLNGTIPDPLGPWLPKNTIIQNAAMGDIANPFSKQDFNPIIPNFTGGVLTSIGNFGGGALPFRPAPLIASASPVGNQYTAKGIYYPSQGLVNYLATGRPGTTNANFSQDDLAWDHGMWQSETYELREAYLHAEFLDGRAWLRVGKQLIVWGKTELFATTDQFNPRDDALSSLPTLEESRIPVFAARGVYNFYTVGPFEDVRIEGALNLDKFTPDDIGVCGEPYAVNAVCTKAFGLFAHGNSGVGIAGQTSPPNWWQSVQGLQGGARLEFRWDRYSFALVDIYNYVRVPYTNQIFTYSRNVDPFTGMPRITTSNGSCVPGAATTDPNGVPTVIPTGTSCLTPQNALQLQSNNQTLFALICSTTVGFSALDRTACAQTVLGSGKPVAAAFGAPVSAVLSHLLAGDPALNAAACCTPVASGGFGATVPLPLVNLKFPGAAAPPGLASSLTAFLTTQQQALLGCGPYYHTVCDGVVGPFTIGNLAGGRIVPGGIDLLNMEASVVSQSFVGFEGTTIGWLTNVRTTPQPGTNGFIGGPVATRPCGNTLCILPGARGPGDPGYNPAIDGLPQNVGFNTTSGNPAGYFPNGQPFTGQQFHSVMAALSWNLEMILVATSPNFSAATELSKTGCGFIRPELCTAVGQFMTVTGAQRNTVNAGGNALFGRRDFVWASGGELNLQYQKRNVLGFSMDFAEDYTKSNWGIEFGWEQHLPFQNNNSFNNISRSDDLELSVSVDRPTFINFLNQNRTFFFNWQFFFSYLTSYTSGMPFPGPFDVLGTYTISTGYFQDRLLPSVTFVWDIMSDSGAILPEVSYRFTENFSLAVGLAGFFGRPYSNQMPVNPFGTVTQQTGQNAYTTFTEPGLSLIRDRDEAYFRLRYTF
jgi:hypothetical protein